MTVEHFDFPAYHIRAHICHHTILIGRLVRITETLPAASWEWPKVKRVRFTTHDGTPVTQLSPREFMTCDHSQLHVVSAEDVLSEDGQMVTPTIKDLMDFYERQS